MFAEGREQRVTKAGRGGLLPPVRARDRRRAALWRRGRLLLVLLAPAVAVCVAAVFGYGVPRLRHGFEIPLMVLAAAGAVALVERLRERRRRVRA